MIVCDSMMSSGTAEAQSASARLHQTTAVFHHDSSFEKIRAVFPAGTHLTVVDAGCGDARLSRCLVSAGHVVFGIDANEEAATQARLAGVQAEIGELERTWPIPNASCDVVLLLDVLEHTVDHGAVLQEARRVLRNNGTLIVGYPNHFDLRQRVEMLCGRGIVHWSHRRYQARAATYGHMRFLRLSELVDVLESSGFFLTMRQFNFMGGGVLPRRVLPSAVRRLLVRHFPNLLSGKFVLRAQLYAGNESLHTVVLDHTPIGL